MACQCEFDSVTRSTSQGPDQVTDQVTDQELAGA
jgi:hypothetical protein